MNRRFAEQFTFFLLRAVAGLLFWQGGAMKLFGWFGGLPREMYPSGTAELMSQIGLAGVLEFFGGIMVMVGLLTRPVAFILSGLMAWAYFQAHQPNGTWPLQNGGIPAVLFCFIFLFFAAHGAGIWSLDAMYAGRSRRA